MRHPRAIMTAAAVVSLFVMLFLAGYVIADRSRARLQARTQPQRLAEITAFHAMQPDARDLVAVCREYLADYPERDDQAVRMALVTAMLGGANANYQDAASQVEAPIRSHLGRYTGTDAGLAKSVDAYLARFRADEYTTVPEWTPSVLSVDVDGDGRQDVVAAYNGSAAGICLLFHHTEHGWQTHRLTLGLHIAGIYSVSLEPGRPRAIMIASRAGNEYDPSVFIDVFGWRQGRMASLLSTTIPHGFQFSTAPDPRTHRSRVTLLGATYAVWLSEAHDLAIRFDWDGKRYVRERDRILAVAPAALLARAQREMDAGTIAEACTDLKAAIAKHDQPRNTNDYEYNWSAHYDLGRCLAIMGDSHGALAEMRHVTSDSDSRNAAGASRFIAACGPTGDARSGLADLGEGFRVIDYLCGKSAPASSVSGLLHEARMQVDSTQPIQLTDRAEQAWIVRFHWPHGVAIALFRRDSLSQALRWRLLTYATDYRPDQYQQFSSSSVPRVVLSQQPALAWYPQPSDVDVVPTVSLSDGLAVVKLIITDAAGVHIVDMGWTGSDFVRASPLRRSMPMSSQLEAIETGSLQNRDWVGAVGKIDDLASRVRAGSTALPDKRNELLEIAYEQALCYRKLGDPRRAANAYSAISHGFPASSWADMAQAWIRYPGTMPFRIPR